MPTVNAFHFFCVLILLIESWVELGRVLGRVLGTKYPEMTENDDPECFWVELNSKDIYGPRVQFGGL